MQHSLSISPTEALFAKRAKGRLPLEQAKITRSQNGALAFQWHAPCEAVGELWLYLHDQQEIMISSLISHTHVERWDIARQVDEEAQIWPSLVDAAIAKVEAIMRGEVAFTETFHADGTRFSCGMCRTERVQDARREMQRLFGEDMIERAYTWFGQVEIER